MAKIEVIVRVTDGSFDTTLSIPVESTKEQREAFAKLWMQGLMLAFDTDRRAALPDQEEK